VIAIDPVGTGVVDSRYLSSGRFQKCCGVVKFSACDCLSIERRGIQARARAAALHCTAYVAYWHFSDLATAARCFLAICTTPPGGDVLRRGDKSGVNRRSQPSSQAASDGSDRPSSKTTQGNMPSIRFMSDAMRKARSSTLSLAGSCSAAHSTSIILRTQYRIDVGIAPWALTFSRGD
jgi:hypothetical protein